MMNKNNVVVERRKSQTQKTILSFFLMFRPVLTFEKTSEQWI